MKSNGKITHIKKEVIKECDRMAVMYPAYMKVKHGGEVVLSDNAVKKS